VPFFGLTGFGLNIYFGSVLFHFLVHFQKKSAVLLYSNGLMLYLLAVMPYVGSMTSYGKGALSYTEAVEAYGNNALQSYNKLEAYSNTLLPYAVAGKHMATRR